MSTAHEVHDLLTRFNLRARKSLGQNFLVDDAALDRIVAAAELAQADTVLEIGPGLGTLTRRLAQRAGRVVAVEIDQNLMPALRSVLAAHSNVELIHGDILQLDPSVLVAGQMTGVEPCPSPWLHRSHGGPPGVGDHVQGSNPAEASTPTQLSNSPTIQPSGDSGKQVDKYKVVANLPYYITSAVIRHLLEAKLRPSRLILTMQLEVAQRIIAGPGALSLLAISVQFYGKPSIVARINAGSFYPIPKVDSAVVRIDVHPQPPVDVPDVDWFFAVVRAGFGQKRKQIHNALRSGLALSAEVIDSALAQANIDPKRRAETLTLDEWAALAAVLPQK